MARTVSLLESGMRYALIVSLIGLACSSPAAAPADAPSSQPGGAQAPPPAAAPEGLAVATFAGGCFWCMEAPFDKTPGVVSTTSGYTDGHKKDPKYKEVGAGKTGHTEGIRVVFDPEKVTYAQLLDIFWHNIDPAQAGGQFCDRGPMYRTGIYFHDAAQKKAAEDTKAKVAAKLGVTVVTDIKAATVFYPAEDYHQDFYKKNPGHYQRYRTGCGRDRRLKEIWGASAGH